MYRRIVLAVDPEGLAESVLPTVATLARRSGKLDQASLLALARKIG